MRAEKGKKPTETWLEVVVGETGRGGDSSDMAGDKQVQKKKLQFVVVWTCFQREVFKLAASGYFVDVKDGILVLERRHAEIVRRAVCT